jgi:hypothetical protein
MENGIEMDIIRWKEQLDLAPTDRRGDEHPDVTRAFLALYAVESLMATMEKLRKDAAHCSTDKIAEDYKMLPEHLNDALSDIVGKALERAEADAPPYRRENYFPSLPVRV